MTLGDPMAQLPPGIKGNASRGTCFRPKEQPPAALAAFVSREGAGGSTEPST